ERQASPTSVSPQRRAGNGGYAQAKTGSVLPEPIEQNRIVGALHHLDLLRDAPHQRLLVQRDVRDLLVDDAHGLCNHLVAFGQIGFPQDFAGQSLDLLAAIAAKIELPPVALLVTAAEDISEYVTPVERAGRPAKQIE